MTEEVLSKGCGAWEGVGREEKDVEVEGKKVKTFVKVSVESMAGGSPALLPACCAALGNPPPSLICSFLTCTWGLGVVGSLRGDGDENEHGHRWTRSADTFTDPLCEWELVCTQAVLLGVIPGALSLGGGEPASFFNLSPLGDTKGVLGWPPGCGTLAPLVPLLKPWGVLAEYKWVNIQLESIAKVRLRKQNSRSPQGLHSQSGVGENSNYELCY